MDTRDIDSFLIAKKQHRWNKRTVLVILITCILYWMAPLIGYDFGIQREINFIIQIIFQFSALYLALGYSNNKKLVTQQHLLDMIERVIQRDPKALVYLSEINKN